MRKLELKIVALASSESQANSFVVVLKEEEGQRRLPVVIGAFEAQAIALALENVHTNRPMTHDLFRNTLVALSINLREVIISDLKFGVFYATLVCEHIDGSILEVDARTSDAIALAVRFNSAIYVYDFIMDEAGIIIDQPSASSPGAAPSGKNKPLRTYSDNELGLMLDEALANEDYERAAEIRDEIQRREEGSS